jgi:hypothetical protein
LSSDVESMFRQQPLKIVLQHIPLESGHSRCATSQKGPLSSQMNPAQFASSYLNRSARRLSPARVATVQVASTPVQRLLDRLALSRFKSMSAAPTQ